MLIYGYGVFFGEIADIANVTAMVTAYINVLWILGCIKMTMAGFLAQVFFNSDESAAATMLFQSGKYIVYASIGLIVLQYPLCILLSYIYMGDIATPAFSIYFE